MELAKCGKAKDSNLDLINFSEEDLANLEGLEEDCMAEEVEEDAPAESRIPSVLDLLASLGLPQVGATP